MDEFLTGVMSNSESDDATTELKKYFSNIFKDEQCLNAYSEADVEEMIEEAASFGNPMSDDEIQYEMKRANHWATIGVGIAGYYQR